MIYGPKLYVVTSISNPVRYASRWRLYRQFEAMCNQFQVDLYTTEVAYGNRLHEVTEENNKRHIQLRTKDELWHKENMLNIAISRLPSDWEYVAWIDADVSFARADWVLETIHQLQHYDIVQMFSVAEDLGPKYEPIKRHQGFVYSYYNNIKAGKRYQNWHPGFAWAARRSAIDALGGLIDIAIVGAADRHMASGLIGNMESSIQVTLPIAYSNALYRWQERATSYIKGNIGYVDGMLLHYWHGKKQDRGYADRWKILSENQYNPEIDLVRDWQGLWKLTSRSIQLRDDLRSYFRSRNEDSNDVGNADAQ